MQNGWKNITGGTRGTFSIYNNPDILVGIENIEGEDSVEDREDNCSASRKRQKTGHNNNRNDEMLVKERQALLDFYNASNGKEWNIRTNWGKKDGPVSSWYGVEVCSETGLVKSIRLPDNNITGSVTCLLPCIQTLTKLKELWLGETAYLGSSQLQYQQLANV